MWENTRKRNIVKNLILLLLIVLIVIVLRNAIIRVNRETDEQDARLSEIRTQQQQQQNEARQKSIDSINDEYQKDLEALEKYLPGIVCWGDSITLGSSGSVSYPYALQKYLDTYITDVYDFRSTIPNAADFSRLDWDEYKIKIPVVNMGAELEDTSTILGRCGVVPYVITAEMVIPEGTDPVNIFLASENGRAVAPLTGGDVGVNDVEICGISGRIFVDSTSYNKGNILYKFVRTESGESVTVPVGSIVKTAASDEYKNYIHVVCIGTYGGYNNNADELVNQIKQLLARQELNSERYIVLGIYSIDGSLLMDQQMDAIDAAMMQTFGNRYINLRKYLCGDGLSDAGIGKSYEDTMAIAASAVPPSFLTGSGNVELNGKAQKLIGKLIFNRMESLGYFDEIYDELHISETVKQIIKDDPGYFDRIITSALK